MPVEQARLYAAASGVRVRIGGFSTPGFGIQIPKQGGALTSGPPESAVAGPWPSRPRLASHRPGVPRPWAKLTKVFNAPGRAPLGLDRRWGNGPLNHRSLAGLRERTATPGMKKDPAFLRSSEEFWAMGASLTQRCNRVIHYEGLRVVNQ